MSEEAKDDARQAAIDWFNKHKRPIVPVSLDDLEILEDTVMCAAGDAFRQWVEIEKNFERIRPQNPRAYFYPAL